MNEPKVATKHNEDHRAIGAKNDDFELQAAQSVSGPLPSSSEMQGYNSISPDLVDRIVSMAEKESDFRHEMEKASLAANKELALNHQAERRRGQFIGVFIALCCLGTSAFLGLQGLETAASVVGGATVVGLVAVFVTGRSGKHKE